MKKLTFSFLLITCLSFQQLFGENICTNMGGYAYESSRRAYNYLPHVTFAAVLAGIIIATGVHNRSHSSSEHSDINGGTTH